MKKVTVVDGGGHAGPDGRPSGPRRCRRSWSAPRRRRRRSCWRTRTSPAGGITRRLGGILVQSLGDQVGEVVRQRVRGAAAILLVVVLCGAAEGFFQGSGMKSPLFLPMAGALSVTLLAAGSLDTLMGLGASTIDELSDLLPGAAAHPGGGQPPPAGPSPPPRPSRWPQYFSWTCCCG